jgi:HSP20 family protein
MWMPARAGREETWAMAERQNATTPTRSERRQALTRPTSLGWSDNPFRMMQRMADEMDRMFEDFGLGRSWFGRQGQGLQGGLQAWAPAVDVFQKDNQLTIHADLPGLRRDEISVEVTDDAVIIQGERKHQREEEREGFYRSERGYGSFYRAIPLPEGAISDQAKAEFKDGVLEITMPAPPASKGRRVEITEGSKK